MSTIKFIFVFIISIFSNCGISSEMKKLKKHLKNKDDVRCEVNGPKELNGYTIWTGEINLYKENNLVSNIMTFDLLSKDEAEKTINMIYAKASNQ